MSTLNHLIYCQQIGFNFRFFFYRIRNNSTTSGQKIYYMYYVATGAYFFLAQIVNSCVLIFRGLHKTFNTKPFTQYLLGLEDEGLGVIVWLKTERFLASKLL